MQNKFWRRNKSFSSGKRSLADERKFWRRNESFGSTSYRIIVDLKAFLLLEIPLTFCSAAKTFVPPPKFSFLHQNFRSAAILIAPLPKFLFWLACNVGAIRPQSERKSPIVRKRLALGTRVFAVLLIFCAEFNRQNCIKKDVFLSK